MGWDMRSGLAAAARRLHGRDRRGCPEPRRGCADDVSADAGDRRRRDEGPADRAVRRAVPAHDLHGLQPRLRRCCSARAGSGMSTASRRGSPARRMRRWTSRATTGSSTPRSSSRRGAGASRSPSSPSSSTATRSGTPSSAPRRSSSSCGTWPGSGSAVTADVAGPDPRVTSSADPGVAELATWRSAAAGPVVAVVALLLALVATRVAGVTFRDWEHAVAWRLASDAVCAGAVGGAGHRGPCGRPVTEAHPIVGGDPRTSAGSAGRGSSTGGRGRRGRELLRDLPGVSQCQERRAAAEARRPLRPSADGAWSAASSAATIRPRCCTACWARASLRRSSPSSTWPSSTLC